MGAFSKKKKESKKGGGLLGYGAGLLKTAGAALSAPQQALLGLASGVNKAVQGDIGGGLAAAGKGLAEIGTAGQIGGDIDLAKALAHRDKNAPGGYRDRKLPFGVNTLGSAVLDPLMYVGVGEGALASKGVSTLGKSLGYGGKLGGTAGVRKAIRAGALDVSKGSAARSALVESITKDIIENSPKAARLGQKQGTAAAEAFARKQAEKIGRATSKRAGGGLIAHVPGTEMSKQFLQGAQPIKRLGGLTLPGTRRSLDELADPAKRAFVTGADLKGELGEQVGQLVHDAGLGRRVTQEAADVNLARELQAVRDAFKQANGRMLTPAENRLIQDALESGVEVRSAVEAAHPTLAPVIQAADRIRKQTTAIQDLPESLIWDEETYLRHTLTREAQKALKGGIRNLNDPALTAGQTATQERRILRGLTPGEANDVMDIMKHNLDPDTALAAARQHIDELGKQGVEVSKHDWAVAQKIGDFERASGKDIRLFREDPLKALGVRGREAHRAVAAKSYVEDLKDLVTLDGDPLLMVAAEGVGRPVSWKTVDIPQLGTFWVHPAVKDEMTRVFKILGQDESVSRFAQLMQKWQSFWKAQVTVLPVSGAFTARNARSNVYLNMLDGLGPQHFKYYSQAGGIQRQLQKVLKTKAAEIAKEGLDEVLKRELDAVSYKVLKQAEKHGILESGFFASDVLTGLKKGPYGRLVGWGGAKNQLVEGNARLANFLFNLDRLGNAAEAARRTKAVLFDYQDLTNFEQKVLKNVIPFYTFMRKNVPAQFAAVIENPSKVLIPEKVSSALTEPGGPEYLEGEGARVPKAGVPSALAKLAGLGGLASVPDRPFQSALKDVERLGSIPASVVTGKSDQALKALSQLSGPQLEALNLMYETATGKDTFTGGNVHGNYYRRLLETAFPGLSRLPKVGPVISPTTGGKGTRVRPLPAEILRNLSGLQTYKET